MTEPETDPAGSESVSHGRVRDIPTSRRGFVGLASMGALSAGILGGRVVAEDEIIVDFGNGGFGDGGFGGVEVLPVFELADYADPDGIIREDGVSLAFDHWESGVIDAALLLDVVNAWIDGSPVEAYPN